MFGAYTGLFVLGLATFLSPCSIALISVFLTYALGIGKSPLKGVAIGTSFALAMCLVFFFLGYAVTSLVPLQLLNYQLFLGLAGFLMILFGIKNLGVFRKIGFSSNIGASLNERANSIKFGVLSQFSRHNYVLGSFLFGLVISVALGPCSLSIVLPAVLLTIFAAPTPFHGGLLLLMFGLGHAIPVIFLSTLLATTRQLISKKITDKSEMLTKGFGVVFLIIGVIIVLFAIFGVLL